MDVRRFFTFLLTLTAISLTSCGYSTLRDTDEELKASWSEVLDQYRHRAKLIPNLDTVFKDAAPGEKGIAIAVANAQVDAMNIKPTLELINDSLAFENFEAAQARVSAALSRLFLIAERSPELKANPGYCELQAQLIKAENSIALARIRYFNAAEHHNLVVRMFPSNLTAMLLGYAVKPNLSVHEGEATATLPEGDCGSAGRKPESSR